MLRTRHEGKNSTAVSILIFVGFHILSFRMKDISTNSERALTFDKGSTEEARGFSFPVLLFAFEPYSQPSFFIAYQHQNHFSTVLRLLSQRTLLKSVFIFLSNSPYKPSQFSSYCSDGFSTFFPSR